MAKKPEALADEQLAIIESTINRGYAQFKAFEFGREVLDQIKSLRYGKSQAEKELAAAQAATQKAKDELTVQEGEVTKAKDRAVKIVNDANVKATGIVQDAETEAAGIRSSAKAVKTAGDAKAKELDSLIAGKTTTLQGLNAEVARVQGELDELKQSILKK